LPLTESIVMVATLAVLIALCLPAVTTPHHTVRNRLRRGVPPYPAPQRTLPAAAAPGIIRPEISGQVH
jgi:hypothetical protein